mmetsp:Transcript_10421/g.31299  ORF Transcript_10421/g.31299 Transcript_10421/m.31299 type:complete len:261 (+) Transcript_10421:2358-3140(+)
MVVAAYVVVQAVADDEVVRDAEADVVGLEAVGARRALLEKARHLEARRARALEDVRQERGQRRARVHEVLAEHHVATCPALRLEVADLDRAGGLRAGVALGADEVKGEGDGVLAADEREVAQRPLQAVEEGVAALEEAHEVQALAGVLPPDVPREAAEPVADEPRRDEHAVHVVRVVRRHGDVRLAEAEVVGDHHGLHAGAAPPPGRRRRRRHRRRGGRGHGRGGGGWRWVVGGRWWCSRRVTGVRVKIRWGFGFGFGFG